VRVVVRIRARHERRSFENLPVSPRGETAEIEPVAVRVVVSGPATVLRELGPADLRPYVNIPASHDPTRLLPVAVEIASGHTGASVVLTEPAEVTARLAPAGGDPRP
jgi:hypothetical protein